MKRGFVFALLIFIYSDCFASFDSTYSYPKEIEKLGLQNKYDLTKWIMYCIMSDRHILFNKNNASSKIITYGTLPLKFNHMQINGDTVEIDFDFLYEGKFVDIKMTDYGPLWGVVFVGNSDTVFRYYSQSDARYFMRRCSPNVKNCPYREVNPLQPEVRKYIKQNKEKLDPWFRKEAQRKGVIK